MSDGGKLPDDVSFTHLDEELFDGAGATKRDLIDYLDAVQACILHNDLENPSNRATAATEARSPATR